MDKSVILQNGYADMFKKLKKDHHYSRLGKPFTTEHKKYFYDTGTGKVLDCTDNVYIILKTLIKSDSFDAVLELDIPEEELLQALEEIKQCVEEEHILQAPKVDKFDCAHLHSLEEYIEHGLQQVILEVTERCNLRCDYCIYGESNDLFRNFGQNDMDFDTAKKAIDYGVKHSPEELTISFYGGEPLLRFNFIKDCIAYCRDHYPDTEFHYSITTNLVLMDEEKAEFIASVPNFSVACSIDGPKEIHDEHRKFPNGEGSFDLSLRGLQNVVTAFGDKVMERLTFTMVTNPPFSQEKFDSIQSFFDSLEWLPNNIVKKVSYVVSGRVKEKKIIDLSETMEDEKINPAGIWTNDKIKNSQDLKNEPLFMRSAIHDSLIHIHKRRLFDIPMENYTFNGCCIPANRRIYVTANGEFKLCERVGESPSIGNVDDGLDMQSIKKHYVDDYMNESVKYCNDCWAVHLCSLCYVECYDEKGFCMEGKISQCNSERYSREKGLIMYHEFLENNPKILEFLNDIVIE